MQLTKRHGLASLRVRRAFVLALASALLAEGFPAGVPSALAEDGQPAPVEELALAEEPATSSAQTLEQLVEACDVLDTPAMTVTVEAPEGALPEGATMDVAPISDADTLGTAISQAATETDVPQASAQAVAVDIAFRDAAGAEVEPTGNVRVTIATEALRDAGQVAVVHVDDEGRAEVVTALDDQGNEAPSVRPAEDEVTFQAGEFSAYVLVYTVDFHYGELSYSLEGEGALLLSQLFEALGIDRPLADVADVTFSDDALVSVAPQGDDWLLTSLAPFDTTEVLTVTLRDGTTITIDVTDASETFTVTVNPAGAGNRVKISGTAQETITALKKTDGTNNNTITAVAGTGYAFDHWELDGARLAGANATSAKLDAGKQQIGTDGSHTLTAVFAQSSSSPINNPADKQAQETVEALMGDWRRAQEGGLTYDKTAQVYDETNRIYQIDLTASSGEKALLPSIDLEFIVDTSRSMYFPATLEQKATFTTKISNKTNLNSSTMESLVTDKSQVYYVVGSDNLATVYAIYYQSTPYEKNKYDGKTGWCYTDASFFNPPDAESLTGNDETKRNGFSLANGIRKETTSGKPQEDLTGVLYTAPDTTTRLQYLKAALRIASQVVYECDPNAQLGLVTFNKTATQKGFYTAGDEFSKALEVSLYGGTRQDLGLAEGLAMFQSSPRRSSTDIQRVAVLITDGAPNGASWNTGVGNSIPDKASNLHRFSNGVDLYTIGLSLDMVSPTDHDNLHSLATNNGGMWFDANDGKSIAKAVQDFLDQLIVQATLVGTVTDQIDPAFYPVDKDGNPLVSGQTYTDAQGHKFTVNESGGTWTVTWEDQDIAWPSGTKPGWNGTVFVKAKEDFLGGNTVTTNSGDNDTIHVEKYKGTYDGKEYEGSFTGDNVIDEAFPSPSVNVASLGLDEHSTTWTVYLNTQVQPKDQVKALFDNIRVAEVVSGTGVDKRRTADSKMVTEDGFEAETFPLADVLPAGTWEKLLAEGAATVDYAPYGHTGVGEHAGKGLGTITLTLTRDTAASGLDAHEARPEGTRVEVFTLTATYAPYDEADPDSYAYHTTEGGSRGSQATKLTSTNTHTINVVKRILQVEKVDASGNRITESPATFTVYQADPAGTAVEGLPAGTYREAGTLTTSDGVATWDHVPAQAASSSGTATAGSTSPYWQADTLYYLLETEPPEGYTAYAEGIAVNLAMAETKTSVIEGKDAGEAPYDLTQEPTLTVTEAGDDVYAVTTQGNVVSFKVRNSRPYSLPSTGGPGAYPFLATGAFVAALGASQAADERRKGVVD